MIITKVELQNITTHVKSTIEFHEGINILSGTNGAGKSTVVKMIGYVLFDHLEQNQNDYVRKAAVVNGPSMVRVWCVGKDRQEYIIERGVGKGASKLEIINAQTGNVIRKINRVEDYQKWLKDQMNLSQDMDIGTIFENAVGVAQGTFTAPFLMTPANRKRVFSPLLNVEIYERVYKRFLEILHQFDDELMQIDFEKQKLEGEIEQKAELLTDKTKIEDTISSLTVLFENITKEFKQVNSNYIQQKEFKEQLEKCVRTYEKLRIQVINQENKQSEKEKAILEAKNAKEICVQTKADFDRYNELTQEEKRLRIQNEKFNQLKQQEIIIRQDIARFESQKEQIEREITLIKSLEEQLPPLEAKYQKYQKFAEEITQKQEEIAKIQIIEKNLAQNKSELKENQQNFQALQEKIKEIPSLKNIVKDMEPLVEQLKIAQNAFSVANTELKQLQKDKLSVKGGQCPFLHEQCKNIKESSLEAHFESSINAKQEEIKILSQTIKEKTQLQTELKKKEEILHSYEKAEVQAKGYQTRIQSLMSQIEAALKAVKTKESIEFHLNNLQTEQAQLEKDVRLYHSHNQKIQKDLPRYEQQLNLSIQKLQSLKKNLEPITNGITELKEVPEQLNKTKNQLEELRENYEKYQFNQQLMRKLPELEQEKEMIQEELAKINLELTKYQNKRDEIKEQFSEEDFPKLENRKNDLQIQSIKMEQEIKNNKSNLQHIEQKLMKLQEREEVLEEITQNRKELNEVYEFSKAIRDLYKEAGPKITKVLLESINKKATGLFQGLIGETAVELLWTEDYNIIVKTPQNDRPFNLLSGGEQMAAALAIRLALLRTLSNIDFAFFDEPTTNLDAEKRKNLAQCIKNIPGFSQLFVISHDDTFETMGDFIIRIEKDDKEESKITFMTNTMEQNLSLIKEED